MKLDPAIALLLGLGSLMIFLLGAVVWGGMNTMWHGRVNAWFSLTAFLFVTMGMAIGYAFARRRPEAA